MENQTLVRDQNQSQSCSVRYFVYFDASESQYDEEGYMMSHYTLDIYEDNDYVNKRDFYNMCISNGSEYSYNFCDENLEDRFIMCIDIEPTNIFRIYCFDAKENINNTLSDTAITPTYLLEESNSNIFNNEHTEEYADTIKLLMEKINFKRCGETFILQIHKNGGYKITNIDRDPVVNEKLRLNK